ncbi:MAG: hypothetical protein ACFFB0_03515 [Promethearchaeota archaeon]
MLIKRRKEMMLAIGMFSLVIMVVLRLINWGVPIIDFFEGLFTGLSLTTNLTYLIIYSKEKNTN